MRPRRLSWGGVGPRVCTALSLVAAGCTFGPPEQRARLSNYSRVPGTYQAVFAIDYERFRRPTGINAFPNGGVARMLERHAVVHVGDVRTGEVHELLRMPAPDSVRVGFGAFIVGLDAQAVYVQLSGCPRASRECYGSLRNHLIFRVNLETGDAARTGDVPAASRLQGTMLARRPGEQAYMRLSRRGDTLAARTDPDTEFEPVFRIDSLGRAHPAGG